MHPPRKRHEDKDAGTRIHQVVNRFRHLPRALYMLKDGTAVDMRELAQILPLFHVRDDIHALAVELIHADCIPI